MDLPPKPVLGVGEHIDTPCCIPPTLRMTLQTRLLLSPQLGAEVHTEVSKSAQLSKSTIEN